MNRSHGHDGGHHFKWSLNRSGSGFNSFSSPPWVSHRLSYTMATATTQSQQAPPAKRRCRPVVFAIPLQPDELIKYIKKFVATTDTSSVQMQTEAEVASHILIGAAAASHLTTECQRIWPDARIIQSRRGRCKMSLVRSAHIDNSLIPQGEQLVELEQVMICEGLNGKPRWFRDS
ncbi:hypothetical protein BD779DRAFT_1552296 [Infundibulicybe gibba]|nr:hypothetical protein BD779DRAFT_1552296 [Infundibulicybe gibba]